MYVEYVFLSLLRTYCMCIYRHYQVFSINLTNIYIYNKYNFIDEEISVGDYILTNGEIPALILIDAISRLIDGVIKKESYLNESFQNDLLDYPVYTKPINYLGYSVPEILLSGNHEKIKEYRKIQQLEKTKTKRPDLYKKYLRGKKDE